MKDLDGVDTLGEVRRNLKTTEKTPNIVKTKRNRETRGIKEDQTSREREKKKGRKKGGHGGTTTSGTSGLYKDSGLSFEFYQCTHSGFTLHQNEEDRPDPWETGHGPEEYTVSVKPFPTSARGKGRGTYGRMKGGLVDQGHRRPKEGDDLVWSSSSPRPLVLEGKGVLVESC